MTFSHLNRRTHLYLGLALLPWFVMYGLSSIPFSHGAWIERTFDDGTPNWSLRFERPYTIELPADSNFRLTGERILKDAGVPLTAFGTYRHPEGQLEVYRYDFRGATRLTYFPDRHLLRVEDSHYRWHHFLTGLHARGEFEQPFLVDRLWAIVVDVVCIGFLLWIASGLYMWWHIRGPHRRWGAAALLAGVTLFAWFVARL